MQLYRVEVDVCIVRPPTPDNCDMVMVIVAVPGDLPNFDADCEAKEIAYLIALSDRRVQMVTACRIVDLTL